jgi:cytochrome c5
MNVFKLKTVLCIAVFCWASNALAQSPAPTPAEPLVFDQILKDYTPKMGETNAHFTFSLTNVSSSEVVINNVRTSCGCTVANMPSKPWHLPAGTNGEFGVVVDLRGKSGTLVKTVFVDSSIGTNTAMTTKSLTVRVMLPNVAPTANGMDNRQRNMMMALADRQAVFRNDCASCHAMPAMGKTGKGLYDAACGICHDAPNRATMVADLRTLPPHPDREYWLKWITLGRPGSLMPSFAQAEGGPLNDDQIDSLVDFLLSSDFQRKGPLPPLPTAVSVPVRPGGQ